MRYLAFLVFPWGAAVTSIGCGGDTTSSSTPDGSVGADDTGAPDTTTTGPDSSPPAEAGTDANTPDAAPPWSPAALTGLVLWLDPTQGLALGDGGPDATVVSWADRSGKNNNATSAGNASILDAAINGLPALHFPGGGYATVADNASLQFGTGDYTIAVVLRHTTPADAGWGYGCIISKQLAFPPPWVGPSLWANGETQTGALLAQLAYHQAFVTSGGTNYNNGQPFYVLEQRVNPAADAGAGADAASATLGLRVNGADAGAVVGAPYGIDVSAVGAKAYLGGTTQSQNLVGDIAEVVVVKGSMSDADTAALEAYFKSKYGL
jgi:hypothetical protein